MSVILVRSIDKQLGSIITKSQKMEQRSKGVEKKFWYKWRRQLEIIESEIRYQYSHIN